MKKALWLVVVAFGAGLLCSLVYAQPGTAPAQTAPKAPEAASLVALQDLALAAQLRQYGVTQKDPMALLVAARLVRAVPKVQPERIAKKPETGKTGQEAEAKPEKPSGLDAGVLLADAKRLAAGDADMLALVAREEQAGATRSPAAQQRLMQITNQYQIERVLAVGSDTYQVTFPAGRGVAVVAGDGDTDLDLFVYDQQGNLVCADTRPGDDCVCEWYATTRSTLTITVKNLGRVYNQYLIAMAP